MSFSIIASTGRTATTYLAAALDQLPGIAATHEGYRGSDKDTAPALPLINLQNAAAYASPASAKETVAAMRSRAVTDAALSTLQADHLIDVAYYNAMLAPEILTQNASARMIGIIRDCEAFVRSATTLTGEDPLPVGWPAPDKPLTDREKFIAMGRIKPGRGSPEKAEWATWGAIRRNIWLWQETNLRLSQAQVAHNDRVALLKFETFRTAPETFWSFCRDFLDLNVTDSALPQADPGMINKKPAGYQIGDAKTWSAEDQAALHATTELIEKSCHYAI